MFIFGSHPDNWKRIISSSFHIYIYGSHADCPGSFFGNLYLWIRFVEFFWPPLFRDRLCGVFWEPLFREQILKPLFRDRPGALIGFSPAASSTLSVSASVGWRPPTCQQPTNQLVNNQSPTNWSTTNQPIAQQPRFTNQPTDQFWLWSRKHQQPSPLIMWLKCESKLDLWDLNFNWWEGSGDLVWSDVGPSCGTAQPPTCGAWYVMS